MQLQDMKISTRLALGFAVMGCLVAAIGGVALVKVGGIEREFKSVMTEAYPKIVLANDVKGVNGEVGQSLRNLLIMTDPDDLQAQYDAIAANSKKTGANIDELAKTITDPAGKAAFEKVQAARAAYRQPRDKVIELVRSGGVEEAKIILVNQVRPKQTDYMARLDDLIDVHEALMDQAAKRVNGAVVTTQAAVAAMVVGGCLVGIALAFWLIRSITRPLNQAVGVARAVAAGDLSADVKAEGHSETAVLLNALQDMKTRLAGIVGDVRRNAEGVATASSQIAHGNQDLSGRTELQASSLQQTAASMEELGSTVRQNADNAQQGNQLALQASNVAVRGGEVVGQVVDTMKGINDSSKKIADIIGVIDGIAFQTNILALNAAVEAARAGEQGRGFAVVAAEVRSLAQRSADAAKEIKGLIGASVERVEQGSALVDQAGVTMQEVVAAIRRVTDIMGEISSASAEQNAGVMQVGEAVTQMDQATQQNAALVEESAAAAESLKFQAQQLVDAVAVFKLAGSATTSVSKAPKALPAPKAKVVATTPQAPKAVASPVDRRGPDRAKNVVRPNFTYSPQAAAKSAAPSAGTPAPVLAKTGSDSDWESF